jgi:hypothetical protein
MPNDSTESTRRRAARRKEAGQRTRNSQPASEVKQASKRTWDEIGGDLEHGADFAGKMTDARLLQGNVLSVSLLVPVQYMHEVMQMTVDSQSRFCFFRGYLAPKQAFLPAEGEGGETQS